MATKLRDTLPILTYVQEFTIAGVLDEHGLGVVIIAQEETGETVALLRGEDAHRFYRQMMTIAEVADRLEDLRSQVATDLPFAELDYRLAETASTYSEDKMLLDLIEWTRP